MFSVADYLVHNALMAGITRSFLIEIEEIKKRQVRDLEETEIIMQTFIPSEIK